MEQRDPTLNEVKSTPNYIIHLLASLLNALVFV